MMIKGIKELQEEIFELRQAFEDYADHQSWRCVYRDRYGECQCGLDDLCKKLGLPIVEVQDPEAPKDVPPDPNPESDKPMPR